MPTVNIYSNSSLPPLEEVTAPLKEYVAQQLTCGDIKLNSDEVSIRFIKTNGSGMLAPLETAAIGDYLSA